MRPRITNEGLAAQIKAMDGVGITFALIKVGNGDLPENYMELEDLVNPLVEIGITTFSLENEYAEIVGIFSNRDLLAPFNWTEVGIFIEDPENEGEYLLYAYGHTDLEDPPESPATIPMNTAEIYEVKLTYRVYIGEADNISAIYAESNVYVTLEDFNNHINDRSNPHKVSKSQVGLGNVENVSVNDHAPTFEVAAEVSTIQSGEKLSSIMGKLARALSSLRTHLRNTNIHITEEERNAWNRKSGNAHTHSANDITSGTLLIERGGTGVNTVKKLKSLVANNPRYIDATLLASGWSGSTYSFENAYENELYNIDISIRSTATNLQQAAFCSARLAGSSSSNVLTAKGRVPTVDIPIIIKVTDIL